MNKPLLIFAIKCSVILYFAACTNVSEITNEKSAAPTLTKGAWKIEFYSGSDNKILSDLKGYNFIFGSSGDLKVSKNGIEINGNWSEDNISKNITIDLGKSDPLLAKLNNYWKISQIASLQVNLEMPFNHTLNRLKITSL